MTEEYQPRCIHLCCKAMLVYGEDFRNDPDIQTGTAEFWCNRTSKGRGPDGKSASLTLCSDAGRTCFEEY